MELNYEDTGAGTPVIILHGLFGALGNWRAVARALSRDYRVITVDLRNHGASPHTDSLDYVDMADDVIDLMDRLGLPSAHLIGHSLGGKLAMLVADRDPERVRRLIVVDIAPRAYPLWHKDVFDALAAVDLKRLRSRADAVRMMAPHLFDVAVREFLATNLKHEAQGWAWRFNLPVLAAEYPKTSEMPALSGFYVGQALFLRGAHSSYIQEDDLPQIKRAFPGACLVTLHDAHHWPHIEAPDEFLANVRGFLAEGPLGVHGEPLDDPISA
ncbi:MAG: alpha/beta fold hydrolase [Halothiobacillaceae bacterium]|nr:alpha/beta fold hydrolase [Halothiobacillaceae bacterium]